MRSIGFEDEPSLASQVNLTFVLPPPNPETLEDRGFLNRNEFFMAVVLG
jgi:hypothetical protein